MNRSKTYERGVDGCLGKNHLQEKCMKGGVPERHEFIPNPTGRAGKKRLLKKGEAEK